MGHDRNDNKEQIKKISKVYKWDEVRIGRRLLQMELSVEIKKGEITAVMGGP